MPFQQDGSKFGTVLIFAQGREEGGKTSAQRKISCSRQPTDRKIPKVVRYTTTSIYGRR